MTVVSINNEIRRGPIRIERVREEIRKFQDRSHERVRHWEKHLPESEVNRRTDVEIGFYLGLLEKYENELLKAQSMAGVLPFLAEQSKYYHDMAIRYVNLYKRCMKEDYGVESANIGCGDWYCGVFSGVIGATLGGVVFFDPTKTSWGLATANSAFTIVYCEQLSPETIRESLPAFGSIFVGSTSVALEDRAKKILEDKAKKAMSGVAKGLVPIDIGINLKSINLKLVDLYMNEIFLADERPEGAYY